MWRSAISSSGGGQRPARRRARRLAGALALVVLLPPWAAAARVLLEVQAALAATFPGCELERQTAYLTPDELAQARAVAGVEVTSALVVRHVATCAGAPGGMAYFDAHRVRTLPETVMVAVDAEGRVERVEVLSFDEPPDYLPGAPWYRQFAGRALDSELALKRGIDGVTGATLTARATTDAVRRVLALHEVLAESTAR